MKKLILKKDLLLVLCNQALLSIGALSIIVILAQYTPPETFGEIRYLVAILTIFSFLSLPGVSLVINHQAALMTRTDLITLVHTQFSWGFIALIGSFLVAGFHMMQGDTLLAQAFIVGGVLCPIANLYLVPGTVLAGMRRFGLKVVIDTVIIISTLTGVVIGTIMFGSALAIVFWYYAMQALATLAALWIVFRLLRNNKKEKGTSALPEYLLSGRQLTYLQVPFSLLPAIEKALVFLILGPVALATFVIAALPVEHFKVAFRNLTQFYMLPHLSGKNVGALIHWFAISAFILALGIIGLVACIVYIMPFLFPDFDGIRHLALLFILCLLPLPVHVITIHWIAERHIIRLSRYTSIAIVSNIISIVFGALVFGLPGAIMGKIFNEVCIAAGLLYLDQRQREKSTQVTKMIH